MTRTIRHLIERIAAEDLGIATLDTRHSDSLDFHDIAVWKLKAALERAYHAGRTSAHRQQQEGDNSHAYNTMR